MHYFGPGVHRPGFIELKDNETVYIAPGAIVYGGIRAIGVSGITVKGRGILDGNWEHKSMVRLEECQNVRFEGITTRYGKGWTNTIVNSSDVQYDNVKVLSFGPGGDGINPLGSRRVMISNCFFRCTDDCIAIKAPSRENPVSDILVTQNTMIGFAYSDGVTIGFETNAEYMRDIVVRDCDVLLARGGSRVDGHSGFSIICDGPAVISNVLFENIRVEESEVKLFELHITDGTKYGTGPSGHIRDITVRDVEWFHEGPIAILGFDENHLVENVLFENCRVGDKPLSLDREGLFVINEFTRNINVR